MKTFVVHLGSYMSPESKQALVSALKATLGPAFKVVVLDASVKSYEIVSA